MCKRGSITVFLTFIFVIIMSLITAVIENTRVLSSDAYVSVAADSAAETVMGDYNRELYEQYKLFGYGGYNGLGEIDINNEFNEILKDNLTVRPENSYKSYSDIYRLCNIKSEPDKCKYITDDDFFDKQISSYLKVVAVDDIKNSIMNTDTGLMNRKMDTDALSVADDYESGKFDQNDNGSNPKDGSGSNPQDSGSNPQDGSGNNNICDNFGSNYGSGNLPSSNSKNTGNDDEKKENEVSDSAGGNPLKCLKDMVKDGILSLVCDVNNVSEKEVCKRESCDEKKKDKTGDDEKFSAGGYLKKYIEDNQSGQDVELEKEEKSSASKIEYMIYAQKMFSSYVNNLNKTVDYGNEYIIAGKENEKDNLLYVVNRLMVMRMAVNYSYIVSDPILQEKSLATATTIAGVIGIPAVITAVKYTILTILAYEESCIDLCAILQGRAVPMVKNVTNFKMSYKEICLGSKNLFKQKALQYGAESDIKRADEFTYIKGIYMLQMLVPKKTIKERMLDLIQHDMRKRFQESFCIDTCICSARFRVSYDIPYAYSNLKRDEHGEMMSGREVIALYEYKS